ncbi:MAG TPA: biotin/lipoyl-containing protein [Chryseolinea sp.]|nr:biotin/lipoyl-containing protein [Chryseolinea sp.]
MYTARINNLIAHEVSTSGDMIRVDGKPFELDLVEVSHGHYHIVRNNKSYNLEVVASDSALKTFSFKLNGTQYSVELRDKFDLLLEKMGMNGSASGKLNNVKAPMPGLIIDLRVREGQSVKAGDPLLILEAMKMENVIKAPGEGVIKTLRIRQGDSVEKNQVLIEF